jgi:outer membrane protein assembly factor BamE (lipoprotein component of BamABCDE complex)
MRVIWPLSVALLLASCSYGNPPIRIINGKRFPVDTARQLTAGMPDTDVRAQLGEPLRVSVEDGQEVWHYAFETQRQEVIRFMGIIPWPAKERGGKLTATVAFRNHILSSVAVTPEALPRVNGGGFSGVIIPRFVNLPESWTPGATQVLASEPKVQQCVASHRRNLRSALPRYFRHYSGTTVNGELALRIQFFDTRHYRAEDLSHAMEVMDAEGDDYFVVVYGLQTERCSF